jgi:uncharacterized protein with PIN domain
MNLADVMDEIGAALSTIDGLRVYPYNADSVQPPAAVVTLPDEIEYDLTMARGGDALTLDVYVFVARIDQRTGRDALAAYLDGSGARSVKAALDNSDTVAYTACDTVRVAKASVEPLISGGVDYLGVVFTLEITGKGA